MAGKTLADCLAGMGPDHAAAAAVRATVLALAGAAISVSAEIASGALGAAFADTRARSAHGDEQKALDLYADERFLEAAGAAPVAVYASEELEHPVVLNAAAPLVLALDPLDGSSNIDTNVSIGTIFSILPVAADAGKEPLASVLQPGTRQLAAGFFCYGPQLTLVLTLGGGTHIFVYAPKVGTFLRIHTGVQVPVKTNEFAINMSNHRFWEAGVRHYVDDCLRGAEGPHGRDYNMRWIASLVAETYRILIRGGVFLYPGDRRKGYANGRLRLVYEANPIAFVVEQAGGEATDTVNPILSLVPTALHQRTPLIFGSKSEVTQIGRYHTEVDDTGIHSPLFGSRGLFRT